jgi:hypothetical protein
MTIEPCLQVPRKPIIVSAVTTSKDIYIIHKPNFRNGKKNNGMFCGGKNKEGRFASADKFKAILFKNYLTI